MFRPAPYRPRAKHGPTKIHKFTRNQLPVSTKESSFNQGSQTTQTTKVRHGKTWRHKNCVQKPRNAIYEGNLQAVRKLGKHPEVLCSACCACYCASTVQVVCYHCIVTALIAMLCMHMYAVYWVYWVYWVYCMPFVPFVIGEEQL